MAAITIAFVGQCHTVGYPGVPPDVAFPQVCRDAVQACRPGERVDVLLQPYYHPSELLAAVRNVLATRPRVVVVEVVGWLAVTGTRAIDLSRLPAGLRSSFERVRHFRHMSRRIVSRMRGAADFIYKTQTNIAALGTGLLRPLLPRYPRPTVAEYESCVAAALQEIRDADGIDAVVQGPGAPNLALDARGIAADAVEQYRAVNEMARRVAAVHGALYVDRWDTIARGFYMRDSVRPTAGGHSVWGHLLAAELIRSGVV